MERPELPIHAHPQSKDRYTDGSVHGNSAPVARGGDVNLSLGPAVIALVVALALVIGCCGVVIGLDIAERSDMNRSFEKLTASYDDLKKQNWLLERRLMDREALEILHGGRLPSDTEFGPTGNMERMKPKAKNGARP